MFLCNLRHSWSFPGAAPPGVVVHVSAFDSGRPTGDLRSVGYVIYDPGVYLWNLPHEDCGSTCLYLATYPWVPIDTPSFEEVEETKRKDWRESIAPSVQASWPPVAPRDESELADLIGRCAEWQTENGASAVVLPAPLIRGLRVTRRVRPMA